MKILVLNCGSSSLKYQLVDSETENVLAKGLCERIGIDGVLKHEAEGKDKFVSNDPLPDHATAVKAVMDALVDADHGVIGSTLEIGAVGHRVVHGGEYFASSVLITEEVKDALRKCIDLAPLHNPANIIGIEACEKLMPGVPQVGVFDTAFHQTMPEKAYLYALPYEYYEKYKVRKYGFHGTSHRFVSQECARLMGKPIEELKIVTCHLGNGASICAVRKGISVDTSMGFTPLDGLAMGTRSGSVDPAAILYIMKKENLTPDEIDTIMNKKSGLLGITGISSDFRDAEAAMNEGNERAKLGLDMFRYQIAKYIGSYVIALGGCDAIVFTAGIGENNAGHRAAICEYLECLGVKIDPEKNKLRGDVDFTGEGSTMKTFIIPTDEELMIAQDTMELLSK